jgi:replicative DNA helicase
MSDSLSLADLEAFDSRPYCHGAEKRFLCPECGDSKPRDTAHRSMAVNTQSGAYICHRCHATGLLTDFWTNTPGPARSSMTRNAKRARISRAFGLDARPSASHSSGTSAPETAPAKDWRDNLQNLRSLEGTPGAAYLVSRGIPLEIAELSRVRFCASWFGRPAVIFPMYDEAGDLVAANGRYIDGRTDPKTRSAGPKSRGLFCAHSINADGELLHPLHKSLPFFIAEAPLDALTLAACGFPAVAFVGTSGPDWMHRLCALACVVLALDADEAGDRSAKVIAGALVPFGARCERLRPSGAKDWNEALTIRGLDLLRARLTLRELRRHAKRTRERGYFPEDVKRLFQLRRHAELFIGATITTEGNILLKSHTFDARAAYRESHKN